MFSEQSKPKRLKDHPGLQDDPIRSFQAQLRKFNTYDDNLRPTMTACEEAIERAELSDAIAFTVNVRNQRPTLIMMAILSSLDPIPKLMRELAKNGLRNVDKEYEDEKMFDVIDSRTYIITDTLQLKVMLTGETCQLVETGTKVVPVYEMKCENGEQRD